MVVPTRGVVGTEGIGVVGERGRSLEMLFDRSMLSKLVPARPKEESSRGGGVSAPSRSVIEGMCISRFGAEGERGRFPPKRPRKAETATDGGRASCGDEDRGDGVGEDAAGPDTVPLCDDATDVVVAEVVTGGGAANIPCARMDSMTSRSPRGSTPLLKVIAPNPARTDLHERQTEYHEWSDSHGEGDREDHTSPKAQLALSRQSIRTGRP